MTVTKILVQDRAFSVQAGAIAQHDRFWEKVNRGTWERDTFRTIDDHTNQETLAIDCGAWIGPTALYMAQRAGLCLGFEPDPVAFATLCRNHELNSDATWIDRLKIFNEAIHSSGAPIQIAGEAGNSMTSTLNFKVTSSWIVQTRRLQDIIAEYRAGFPKIFVKIDVEGGEYDILPSIADVLADESVSFLISFHHRRLKLALEHRHETPAAANEELTTTVRRVVDALPWGRQLRTLEGEMLQRKAVERAADRGKSFAAELLID